jgi:hypothetical protein
MSRVSSGLQVKIKTGAACQRHQTSTERKIKYSEGYRRARNDKKTNRKQGVGDVKKGSIDEAEKGCDMGKMVQVGRKKAQALFF